MPMNKQAIEGLTIRAAQPTDLDAITEIFNDAILNTTTVFFFEPRSRDQQLEWFQSHGPRHPILVAELDGNVIGWTSLSPWSDRDAYRDAAETSSFVAEGHRGKGIGRQLKTAIIEEARRLGFHTLVARVAEESAASMHLNEDFGFEHVGTLKEIGQKFGKLLDVHILQKMLG